MLALIAQLDGVAQAAGGWNLVLVQLASQVIAGTMPVLAFIAAASRYSIHS